MLMVQVNPFIIEGYLSPEYFCDRVEETALLTRHLTNRCNVALIAPRRLGKSGLIYNCFQQENIRDQYHCIYIDIYDTKNLGDFVYTLGKGILTALKPKGRKVWEFFLNTLQSLKSTISFDINGNPEWSVGMGDIQAPDITLDEIQNLVSQMSVGKTGKAFLISSDGTYLYTQDSGKIMNEKITDSKNSSLAKVGTKMLDSDSGKACFTEGITGYTVYYETIPDLDWKLGIAIENSELNAPVISLGIKLAIIAAVILIIMILVILSQVKSVSRQINRVKNFAVQLAEGNFKVQSLESRRSDELGAMGQSLNEMYGNNKDMISKISGHAKLLSDSSIELKRSVEELKKDYEMIESLMNQVNSDMTSSSAATEEVNAAVEEVNSSVNMLASETEKSLELAGEIKKRANGIEDTSRNAYELANKLAAQNRAGLEESIKNADVVKSIGALAEVISEIADQINLLSLNASIEAARAGEQGKGFAVVAGEIGNLAGETTAAVNKIKETIGEVEHAFSGIVEQSQSMLNFVTDTVAPDYDTFVNVAQQYGDDAQAIEKFSNDIAQMAANIETIIHEVSQAVSSVAESSQNTVDNSGQIMKSVNSVSAVVGEVSDMSSQQEKIAGELKEVVGKFVL